METAELLVIVKKRRDKAFETILERRKRAKNSTRVRVKRMYDIFIHSIGNPSNLTMVGCAEIL